MDLLVTITGKVFTKVVSTADVVKVEFAITPLFEVVYGPITGIGGDLSAFHSGSDTPPHRVLSYFLFCRRREGHIGTGDTGTSREIRRRMVLNSCREMATSAIWNVTYRAWVTTLAPILISFSLKVVIDQCLTLGGGRAYEESCPGCMPTRTVAVGRGCPRNRGRRVESILLRSCLP